jgi:hypothetical protein
VGRLGLSCLRVFDIQTWGSILTRPNDVLACPRGGGQLRVIATMLEAILAHRAGAPAPPGPTGSPQLSPSLDAAPDMRRRPPGAPKPRPSTRFLTTSPWRRRMTRGQRAIALAPPAFGRYCKRAVPVSGWGVRRRTSDSANPGRRAREPREQRLSVLCIFSISCLSCAYWPGGGYSIFQLASP